MKLLLPNVLFQLKVPVDEKDKAKKYKLKCIAWLGFDDIVENRHINYGDVIEVNEERAEELLGFRGCFDESNDTIKT